MWRFDICLPCGRMVNFFLSWKSSLRILDANPLSDRQTGWKYFPQRPWFIYLFCEAIGCCVLRMFIRSHGTFHAFIGCALLIPSVTKRQGISMQTGPWIYLMSPLSAVTFRSTVFKDLLSWLYIFNVFYWGGGWVG